MRALTLACGLHVTTASQEEVPIIDPGVCASHSDYLCRWWGTERYARRPSVSFRPSHGAGPQRALARACGPAPAEPSWWLPWGEEPTRVSPVSCPTGIRSSGWARMVVGRKTASGARADGGTGRQCSTAVSLCQMLPRGISVFAQLMTCFPAALSLRPYWPQV